MFHVLSFWGDSLSNSTLFIITTTVHIMPVTSHSNSNQLCEAASKEIFRRANAVCFDVDSTLIVEEGIDQLAKYCGAGAQVAEM